MPLLIEEQNVWQRYYAKHVNDPELVQQYPHDANKRMKVIARWYNNEKKPRIHHPSLASSSKKKSKSRSPSSPHFGRGSRRSSSSNSIPKNISSSPRVQQQRRRSSPSRRSSELLGYYMNADCYNELDRTTGQLRGCNKNLDEMRVLLDEAGREGLILLNKNQELHEIIKDLLREKETRPTSVSRSHGTKKKLEDLQRRYLKQQEELERMKEWMNVQEQEYENIWREKTKLENVLAKKRESLF